MLTTVFSFKARDLFPQTSHCKGMLSIYQYFFPEGRGGGGRVVMGGVFDIFLEDFFLSKTTPGCEIRDFFASPFGST